MARAPGEPFDLLVIGGGINGAGIARDAAGRGLSVLLCEKNDLGWATSSASTKLIHGGLRYLEYYEFRLVREALAEREVLLKLAPHIIWPLRFVMPHAAGLRPAWMIRAGLFLYDHIGGRRSLPCSAGVDFRKDDVGAPLKHQFRRGFVYSDCWVDDARLVVLNAAGAAERGAEVLTRTACTAARRESGLWHATLTDTIDGATRSVTARAIVNAAGPWVQQVLTGALGQNALHAVRLVKGSHIVTPKLFEGRHAYILQNDDRRVIFAIPYEGDFTLIGTTDRDADSPEIPHITPDEIVYLCNAASRYFRKPVAPGDVVWTYSGVRPLYDDGRSDPSAVTRDYVLMLDGNGPPLLSVYGGKITTYRRLAEAALAKIAPYFPQAKPAWTHDAPLPGGELGAPFDEFVQSLAAARPGLDRAWLERLARRHGSRAEALLGDARQPSDLGEDFGGGLYERELDWLIRSEWVRMAEDALWRRTKCGLHMSEAQRRSVAERLTG